MSIITVIFIGLALSMDAFAVSISKGIIIKRMHLRHALRISLFFGGFQAIMPVLGWAAGRAAEKFICDYDHWLAFVLLFLVGTKMIYEAIKDHPEDKKKSDPLNFYILLTLAIATSIDAGAIGISLSFLNVNIIQPAILIGVITFTVCLFGTYIGKKSGEALGKKIEILGGLVLIGIGLKILIQHVFYLG